MRNDINNKLISYAKTNDAIESIFCIKNENYDSFYKVYTIVNDIIIGKLEDELVGLFDDVIRYYNSSIKWNFISGSLICILWFLRCECKIYQIIVCILSFILFFYSMRVTYKAYSFLIYFIKKQKK